MVELRALNLEYAPLIVDAAQESIADVRPWMPWCSEAFDLRTAEEWIGLQIHARETGSAYEFAVFDEDGQYVGGGGVNRIDRENHIANLGYWIRSSRAGCGYGTATLRALMNWARQHTDLNRLEVVVATGNAASQRVAEKAGAVRERTAKARLFLHGHYHDAVIYAFTHSA